MRERGRERQKMHSFGWFTPQLSAMASGVETWSRNQPLNCEAEYLPN